MVKFPEADARLFKNIFVCKKCKSRLRADSLKVSQGVISCRKCKYSGLRPIRKK